MREYKAVVLGEPVAQGRPRFSRQGGFVKAYDPAKSRDYKQYVRLVASEDAPEAPVTGAVVLSLKIYRSIPKSMSKRKREAALAGRLRPTTKPDVSNVLKGVEDALKGLWYADDSQIVGYGTLGKWYAERPRIEIAMQEIEEMGENGKTPYEARRASIFTQGIGGEYRHGCKNSVGANLGE